MDDSGSPNLRRSLIENAYDSFAESLGYVESARHDASRWKYAVLNLVHAVELMLNKRLADEHELLIWQDVDHPGRTTVSLENTIKRLLAASIALGEEEQQAIRAAVKWRNNITHYEVDLVADEVRENYLLIFEFLDSFHGEQFGGSLSEHIPDEHIQTAADLTEQFKREFIDFRGRTMHRAWVRKLVAAQRVPKLFLDGVAYERRAWGSELYWEQEYSNGFVPLPYCRDCAARVGELHGPGCCVEECPRENGQLFGCECDWEPSELWALDDDEWDEDAVDPTLNDADSSASSDT
ncbi:hypothetical protein ACTHAM_001097 [Cellulomonas soli]|uniref:hypothetical protein n=1 Tax=Cellulomonas soli TaxID=931535 RepID=UPI003F82E85A